MWGVNMQETEFKDRRIFERIPVRRSLRFLAPRSNLAGLAQTRDISAQGIGIMTEKELSPQTPLEIWLHMPDSGEPFYTTGKVIWSEQIESNRYRAGIKLDRVDLMGISSLLKTTDNKEDIAL